MNIEQQRVAFEAACHAHADEAGYDGAGEDLTRDGDGYADPATQAAWWGWRTGLDRQGRGEPVADMQIEKGVIAFYPNNLADTLPKGSYSLYTAPQPAEPANGQAQQDAIRRAIAELSALTPKQFRERLEQCKDDPFALALESAYQDAAQPAPCASPMSDKPTCGAQNAECERQRDANKFDATQAATDLFERMACIADDEKCIEMLAAALTKAQPDPAMAGDDRSTKPLTDQNIYDRFSFLEGLVNEHTYIEIAETAIGIYKNGRRVQPASGEDANA